MDNGCYPTARGQTQTINASTLQGNSRLLIITASLTPRRRNMNDVHEMFEACGPANVQVHTRLVNTSELAGAPPDNNVNVVCDVCWHQDNGGGEVRLDAVRGTRFECGGTKVDVYAGYENLFPDGPPIDVTASYEVSAIVQWGGGFGRAGPFDAGYTPPMPVSGIQLIPSKAVSLRPLSDANATVTMLSATQTPIYTYLFAAGIPAGGDPRPVRAGAVYAQIDPPTTLLTYEIR
jgi:hypothetical protein